MSWHSLHFNKIAKVIRTKREVAESFPHKDVGGIIEGQIMLLNELTLEFTEYFRDQNPSFEANKFIEACGYKPEVKDES